MQANEKAKAQRTIEKIESGAFDDNDIDNLFMRLRAFSTGYNVFREIADFVAHNDARDRGVTNKSLEAFYLNMRYFCEYVSQDVSLDISKPFPSYVKQLMKFQVDRSNEQELRAEFRVTRERLKSRIDFLFKEDKKSKTAIFKRENRKGNLRRD